MYTLTAAKLSMSVERDKRPGVYSPAQQEATKEARLLRKQSQIALEEAASYVRELLYYGLRAYIETRFATKRERFPFAFV